MEQPLVSVVVVSYNHAKYINEILDSIKKQTYGNIELIVADDASKDNSVEVFEQWLKDNQYSAKKNYHTQNTGLATMLNECLELVTGKYVKLIAADDVLHPESIEKCVNEFSKNENLGFVFTDTYFIDENSNLLERDLFGRAIYQQPVEKMRYELMDRCFIPAPSALIFCKAMREVGQYDPTKVVEDYDRWLRILDAGYDFTVVNEQLTYYRAHRQNLSVIQNTRMAEEVFMLNFKYSNKKKKLNTEIENIFLRTHHKYSSEFFKAYKEYKYRDILSYFFIKNNHKSLLKLYRIIKGFLKS